MDVLGGHRGGSTCGKDGEASVNHGGGEAVGPWAMMHDA